MKKKMKKVNWTAICFIAPNYLGFLLFIVLPVLFSLGISFTDFNIFKGFDETSFVGIKNYKNMFGDVWFTAAVKNNVIYTLVTIPVLISLSMIVATILNNKVYLKNLFRSLVFIPYISSIVAISVVWRLMYNPSSGVINQFLRVLCV